MNNCVNHGEFGKRFYIMVRGVVSVDVPHPAIQDYGIKLRDYQSLLEWKKGVFDFKY